MRAAAAHGVCRVSPVIGGHVLSTVPSGGTQSHGAPDRLWTGRGAVTGLGQQGVCWGWLGARRADTAALRGTSDLGPGHSDPVTQLRGRPCLTPWEIGPSTGRWGSPWRTRYRCPTSRWAGLGAGPVVVHMGGCERAGAYVRVPVYARAHMPQFSFLRVSASGGTRGLPQPLPRHGLPGLSRACRWDEPSAEGAELCGAPRGTPALSWRPSCREPCGPCPRSAPAPAPVPSLVGDALRRGAGADARRLAPEPLECVPRRTGLASLRGSRAARSPRGAAVPSAGAGRAAGVRGEPGCGGAGMAPASIPLLRAETQRGGGRAETDRVPGVDVMEMPQSRFLSFRRRLLPRLVCVWKTPDKG